MTHTVQTPPSYSVLLHVTRAHFYFSDWSTDTRKKWKNFVKVKSFLYFFCCINYPFFLSFSLPFFSFFLHGQFFCSRASGSTPTCPKRSAWSLPKVTRRSASQNNKQLQPLRTRLLCTHLLDVSTTNHSSKQMHLPKLSQSMYGHRHCARRIWRLFDGNILLSSLFATYSSTAFPILLKSDDHLSSPS